MKSSTSINLPLAALFLFLALGQKGKGDTRPNILWIMSDDHAAQAVGAYGGRLASLDPTPTLDRLAAEGVRFENMHCGNSICTPSRASLLTGQHSNVNGVRTLSDELPVEKQYLPQEFRKAGYETAMIGKWHLTVEPASFDYYCVVPGQGTYYNPTFYQKGKGQWPDNLIHFSASTKRHASKATHSSDAITDLSLEWLSEREKDKPFFLMHHFKAPHGNWENASRYDFLYDGVTIPEPKSLWIEPNNGSAATEGVGSSIGKRYERRNVGHQMSVDESLPPSEYKHVAYQRYLKRYLRCVRGIDDNIARLLAHLEETGEIDNTIILYSSDQGMMLGEHDYMDKRWMYEESLRMPLIVRDPRLPPSEQGSIRKEMISNIDWAPTLLDLGGIQKPDYMQGDSFKSVLEGATPKGWKKSIYYRYWMNMAHHDVPAHYGVRTEDYKLIFFYGLPLDAKGALDWKTTPGWELYDLRKDPKEMNNVYDNPEYSDVRKQLKKELLRLKEQYGDTDEAYPELTKLARQ